MPRSKKLRVTLKAMIEKLIRNLVPQKRPEEDAGSHPLEHSGVKEGGHPRDGLTEFDCTAPEEEIVSHPLEHSGVVEWAGVSDGLRKRSPPESFEICTDPA